ncbi:DMT family transporter [Subdoligranulum variabile]|uniref:DMT family transporter n=1 Tax=Subdoligranulum variabile TaxID=214851 RepID=UPI0026E96836|nr:DMT family transporter [Subdoligranulum variabile]
MKEDTRSLAALHLAVMLFGLSAMLGRFVTVPAVLVAGGRVVCSAALLLVLCLGTRTPLALHSRRDTALALGTGVVLAVHWTTFFQAIQCSSVALGTISFSTFPLFVTFLEPLVFHEALHPRSVLRAGLLLAGVLITVPEFSLANRDTAGIAWGLVSSLAYAVMTLCNRRLSARYPARVVCLYEQGTAAVVLLPALLLVPGDWTPQNLAGVAVIGFVCTALAHSLYVAAQKHVKAQTAGLVSGMETVYSILYALVFLGEVPSLRALAGGAVILGVAVLSSLRPVR